MEIKGLKENGKVKDKMKIKSWNIENLVKLAQDSSKACLSEFDNKIVFYSRETHLSKQYLA